MGLVENILTGILILTVMLVFAEYERGMIVKRTQTSKAVARQIQTSMKADRRSTPNVSYSMPWNFWTVTRATNSWKL